MLTTQALHAKKQEWAASTFAERRELCLKSAFFAPVPSHHTGGARSSANSPAMAFQSSAVCSGRIIRPIVAPGRLLTPSRAPFLVPIDCRAAVVPLICAETETVAKLGAEYKGTYETKLGEEMVLWRAWAPPAASLLAPVFPNLRFPCSAVFQTCGLRRPPVASGRSARGSCGTSRRR